MKHYTKPCPKTAINRRTGETGLFIGWESTNKNVGWIRMQDGTVKLGNRKNISFDDRKKK